MKIKKLILLSALITSASLAEASGSYIKLKHGMLYTESNSYDNDKIIYYSEFGVGYYISNNIRADFSLSYIPNIKQTAIVQREVSVDRIVVNPQVFNLPISPPPPAYASRRSSIVINASPPLFAARRASIQPDFFMLPPIQQQVEIPKKYITETIYSNTSVLISQFNIYIDIIKTNNSSLFIGAGVGVARTSGTIIVDEFVKSINPFYNLTYDVIKVGIAHKFKDGIYIEVGYSYKYLSPEKKIRKVNDFSLGLRIDM